jgi:hypothetical protein
MSQPPPGTRTPPGRAAYVLAAVVPFVAIVVASLVAIARMDPPKYGVWTGIRPLETKMDMLASFAAQGDVDALVVGSSIVDFGFNAELFSELMSKHLGRPYRAFNFATGGAEPNTLPILYKLARMVSKPKAVIVMVPPEPYLPDSYVPAPNAALAGAPIAPALEHEWLLPISRRVYESAVLRNAPALRDLVMWGDFHNLQRQVGMESYHVDSHGDRVAYTFPWQLDMVRAQSLSNELVVKPYTPGAPGAKDALHYFFNEREIRGMDELRELVARDGGKIILATHAASATWWRGTQSDPVYVAGRRQFFDEFARRLGAEVWNSIDAPVDFASYCLADSTHLNAYGAALYTRLLFQAASGAPLGDRQSCTAQQPDFAALKQNADPTLNLYSGVIERPARQAHALLWFRTVISLAVPKLPVGEDLLVALRTPDGKDFNYPAIELGNGEFMAEVDLPVADRPQVLLTRLLVDDKDNGYPALSAPIAEYEWITGFSRRAAVGPPGADGVQVAVLPRELRPGETLYVAANGASAGRTFDARITSLADGKPVAAESPVRVAAGGDVARIAMPRAIRGGRYEVALLEGATQVAKSAPISVDDRVEVKPRIWTEPMPGGVRVRWANIRNVTRGDWVGIFPAGGTRDSRLDSFMTESRAEGTRDYRLHPVIFGLRPPTQLYEFRLFANGGYRLLARSEPFRFQEAKVPDAGAANAKGEPPEPARIWTEADPATPGRIHVAWSGIANPTKGDWIGLYRKGSDDPARIDMVFTGSKAEGALDYRVAPKLAPQVPPGEYEFRLFADGGWRLLARSEPFAFGAP